MATPKAVTASLAIQPFTSSEPGAWSNSYLIRGESEAIVFDVFMLRSDAAQVADGIKKSGQTLKTESREEPAFRQQQCFRRNPVTFAIPCTLYGQAD